MPLYDVVLLAIALSGLSLTIFILLYIVGYCRRKQIVNNPIDVGNEVLRKDKRRGQESLRKRKEKKRNDREAFANEAALDEDANAPVVLQPHAMTKKQLQKELKRHEREELREYNEQRREEQRKQEEALNAAIQMRKEAESAEDAHALQIAKERARKEKEEYDSWKEMFVIEEAGTKQIVGEESQQLLQQFIDHIKLHKVVLLEDLGAAFNLTTRETIQRVEALQETNQLSGIIDDRGKFIYITEEEMNKVARFISRKGRVGLTELARECNRLIRMESEKATSTVSIVDWLNEQVDNLQEATES